MTCEGLDKYTQDICRLVWEEFDEVSQLLYRRAKISNFAVTVLLYSYQSIILCVGVWSAPKAKIVVAVFGSSRDVAQQHRCTLSEPSYSKRHCVRHPDHPVDENDG